MADPVEPPSPQAAQPVMLTPAEVQELTARRAPLDYTLLLSKAEYDAVKAAWAVSSPPSTDPAPGSIRCQRNGDCSYFNGHGGECGNEYFPVPSTDPPSDERPQSTRSMRQIDFDTDELRLIGEWLNAAHPIDEDSDGDRVLKAADTIDRLSGRAVPSLPVPDPPDDVRQAMWRILAAIDPAQPWLTYTQALLAGLDAAGLRVVFAEGLPMGAHLEAFTKFRQRHERGRIEVMQHSEMWMDGEWLFRVLTDKEPSDG